MEKLGFDLKNKIPIKIVDFAKDNCIIYDLNDKQYNEPLTVSHAPIRNTEQVQTLEGEYYLDDAFTVKCKIMENGMGHQLIHGICYHKHLDIFKVTINGLEPEITVKVKQDDGVVKVLMNGNTTKEILQYLFEKVLVD